MKYKDYYEIMAVARQASQDEIKKAYRKLARKYHPDVSKEKSAEERFKEIGEAYEVLKDPEKRAAYDRLGRHQAGQDFRPPPDWQQQYARDASAGEFSGVDLGDFFADLFGSGKRAGAREGRTGRTGGTGRTGQGGAARGFAMRGQDFEVNVELSLEDAYRGTEIGLELGLPEIMPDGALRRTARTVKVRIPKGVVDGQKMRVPGKGGPGSEGAANGDLYLNISLRPHRLFKASGSDLYLELPIAPWEAALGASVEAPTMEGKVRLKIPAGTRAGQRLRVAGRGLPRPGDGAGDLYAILQIVTPLELSAREKALFEQLAADSKFNPRQQFDA